MLVESAVETYLCSCVRCAARWTESYQVNQVTDDAGAVSSFYRHAGVPCEAPAATGNVRCPNCGSSRVRKDPVYGDTGVSGQDLLPGPGMADVVESGAGPHVPAVPRPRAPGTWRRFKFAAVVTLDGHGPTHLRYASGAPGLMVHVPSCRQPSVWQYFPAAVFTDDGRALVPGDRGVFATISVPDDDASVYFQAGQRFRLWDGIEVGHGTVALHMIFGWPELGGPMAD